MDILLVVVFGLSVVCLVLFWYAFFIWHVGSFDFSEADLFKIGEKRLIFYIFS